MARIRCPRTTCSTHPLACTPSMPVTQAPVSCRPPSRCALAARVECLARREPKIKIRLPTADSVWHGPGTQVAILVGSARNTPALTAPYGWPRVASIRRYWRDIRVVEPPHRHRPLRLRVRPLQDCLTVGIVSSLGAAPGGSGSPAAPAAIVDAGLDLALAPSPVMLRCVYTPREGAPRIPQAASKRFN